MSFTSSGTGKLPTVRGRVTVGAPPPTDFGVGISPAGHQRRDLVTFLRLSKKGSVEVRMVGV